jgi:hypothetical protein
MRKQNLTIQDKFKEAYKQAVEEALSILGKNISVVINSYILEKYSIRLTDTGDNPKVLSDALEAVIDGGSRIVQRGILRLLYNRIGLDGPFLCMVESTTAIISVISMIIISLSSIAARICITTITTMSSVAAVMPITGSWLISVIWTFLSSKECNSHLLIKPPYWLFCLPQNSMKVVNPILRH